MLDLVRRLWSITTRIIQRLWSIQFLRFLAVGGVNTAFGYGVFALLILLNRHFRICSPEVELVLAPLISQICGILFNFKTTGTLVFRNRNNRLILRFVSVYSTTYLLNYGLLRLFESFGVGRLVGGAILVLPLAILAYTLNRKYVFNTLDKKTKPVVQPTLKGE
jgi:putative flippase GtrA